MGNDDQYSLQGLALPPPPVRGEQVGAVNVAKWRLRVKNATVILPLDYSTTVEHELRITRLSGVEFDVEIASSLPYGHPETIAVFFRLLRRAYVRGLLVSIEGVEPSSYVRWFDAVKGGRRVKPEK